MVAAASVLRQGPDSSSAAFRKMAARSSYDKRRHSGAAALAASTASRASSAVALWTVPSTASLRCGCTTSMGSPPPMRSSPPMFIVSSTCSPASCLRTASSPVRSAEPGAKLRTGSLIGVGTCVTASNMSVASGGGASLSRDGTQEEEQVRRTLSHPAGEVGVPGGAEGDVDADAVPPADELVLQVAADAVQELDLELPGASSGLGSGLARVVDEVGVVRTEGRVAAVLAQPVGEELVLRGDVLLALEGSLDRLRVGTLDQTDP